MWKIVVFLGAGMVLVATGYAWADKPAATQIAAVRAANATPPATQRALDAAEADRMARMVLAAPPNDLVLGASTLARLVPDLAVDAPDPVPPWDEAVALADRMFADSPARRALFLAFCLRTGDPGERLKQLKLTDKTGPMTGMSLGTMLVLRDKPAPAYLDFWLDVKTPQLTAPPYVRIFDVAVNGVRYSLLSFDHRGRLSGWERTFPIAGGGEIRARGNRLDGRIRYEFIRMSKEGKIEIEGVEGPKRQATQPAATSHTDGFLKLLRDRLDIKPAERFAMVSKAIDWDALRWEAQKAPEPAAKTEPLAYVEFWKRLAEAHDFGNMCSRPNVFEWKACELLAGKHKSAMSVVGEKPAIAWHATTILAHNGRLEVWTRSADTSKRARRTGLWPMKG